MRKMEIKNITADSFSKYGTVIEFTPNKVDGWEILVRVENMGWRIAMLEFTRRSTKVIERHSNTRESFEPMEGVALLIAAEYDTPEDFEVFLLDKPICLNEGVWHQVLSLSEKSKVKISENLEVPMEFYYFDQEISPCISY